MTDYFALLDQAPRPWLDEQELKSVYHAKTLELHPDARSAAGCVAEADSFAALNEAYRTLRDPALRLHYLLGLHGPAGEPDNSIPAAIQELFPTISSAMAEAKRVAAKLSAVQAELMRGLLAAEALRARNEIERLLERLAALRETALGELLAIDQDWDPGSQRSIASARELQRTLTYLSRWIAQLKEVQFQLGSS